MVKLMNIFFSLLFLSLFFFGCSPKFDNPLDPNVGDEPSLYVELYHSLNDTTSIDSTRIIQTDFTPLYFVFGFEDKRDVDVNVEYCVSNKHTQIQPKQIFTFSEIAMRDTIEFLPTTDGNYQISFRAYDAYQHQITFNYNLIVDKIGMKNVYISGAPNNNGKVDFDIIFDSYAGINFDALQDTLYQDSLLYIEYQNTYVSKGNKEDWISFDDVSDSVDCKIIADSNRVILKNVPITNQKESASFKFRYKLIDLVGRVFQDKLVEWSYDTEPNWEVEMVNSTNRFNESHPIYLRFTKEIAPDSLSLIMKKKDSPDEESIPMDFLAINPYIVQLTDYHALEENENYTLTVKYENFSDSLEFVYDKKGPSKTSISPEDGFVSENIVNCVITFDEDIGYFSITNQESEIENISVVDSVVSCTIKFPVVGEYNYTITCSDEVGNYSDSNFTYKYSAGFAITNIDPPENTILHQDTTVVITTNNKINQSPSDSYIYCDDVLVTDLLFSDNETSVSFQTEFNGNGVHNIRVHLESNYDPNVIDSIWSYTYQSEAEDFTSEISIPDQTTLIGNAEIEITLNKELDTDNSSINMNGTDLIWDNIYNHDDLSITFETDFTGVSYGANYPIILNLKSTDTNDEDITDTITYVYRKHLVESILPVPGDTLTNSNLAVNVLSYNQIADDSSVLLNYNPIDGVTITDNSLNFEYVFTEAGEVTFTLVLRDIFGQQDPSGITYTYQPETEDFTYDISISDQTTLIHESEIKITLNKVLDTNNSSINMNGTYLIWDDTMYYNPADSNITFETDFTDVSYGEDYPIILNLKSTNDEDITDTVTYIYREQLVESISPDPELVLTDSNLTVNVVSYNQISDDSSVSLNDNPIDSVTITDNSLNFEYVFTEAGEVTFTLVLRDIFGQQDPSGITYTYQPEFVIESVEPEQNTQITNPTGSVTIICNNNISQTVIKLDDISVTANIENNVIQFDYDFTGQPNSHSVDVHIVDEFNQVINDSWNYQWNGKKIR